MSKQKLLIIDDELNMRQMLKSMLSGYGFDIVLAENGEEALALVKDENFKFILCDIRMPQIDGLEFLSRGREYLVSSTVIMMSAYGSIDLALESMKKGAYDFISKPFKTDEVLLSLKKAEEREMLRDENKTLKAKIRELIGEGEFPGMVGKSESMRELFRLAAKIAVHDTTVLITGESGTGKELLARGIHDLSAQKDKPFFAINCASIPEPLLESELFGFKKGAFTGADSSRKGLFVEADGSTLFLDEVGEMTLAMQVKLLRVLQEGEIRPIGHNVSQSVKVRILAATSRDLEALVENGGFREDLYYRLNVVRLKIPPLRKRLSDIRELSDVFLAKINNKFSLEIQGFSAEASAALMRHTWPGNVRELENVIESALIMTENQYIQLEDLPMKVQAKSGKKEWLEDCLDDLSIKKAKIALESLLIHRALEVTGGNKSKAAELLELSYPSLLNKIKTYHLDF